MLPPLVDDVGTSSLSMSSSHVCVPHTCIMCKHIFLGLIGDIFEYYFVFEEDTPDVHIEATHPNTREEGHAEAWTPSILVNV